MYIVQLRQNVFERSTMLITAFMPLVFKEREISELNQEAQSRNNEMNRWVRPGPGATTMVQGDAEEGAC